MDIKDIRQIVDLMKKSELIEFEIEEKDLKLRICRESQQAALQQQAASAYSMPMPAQMPPPQAAPGSAPAASAPAAAPVEDANVKIIKSPMVGTFYRAPSPESTAFVELNTPVTNDSVVCIIEAMKVMNEIQSEVSGKIIEILVENGQAVEYGQPLFKVKA